MEHFPTLSDYSNKTSCLSYNKKRYLKEQFRKHIILSKVVFYKLLSIGSKICGYFCKPCI